MPGTFLQIYILNQAEHHKKKTFKKEYLGCFRNSNFNTMKSICLTG